MRIATLLKKLAVAAASPVIFFGAADFIVDVTCYVPRRQAPISFWGVAHDTQFDEQNAPFRPSLRYFWEPNPGGIFEGETINSDGYRGAIVPREHGKSFRIVTLGDSSTMGYGVKESQAWPRRLEAVLRARGYDAEVLNLGVVGYSVYQGMQYFINKGLQYHPDLVITAFGAINEQFREDRGFSDMAKGLRLATTPYRVHDFMSRFTLFRWLETKVGPQSALGPPAASGPAGSPHRVTPEEFATFEKSIFEAARAAGCSMAMVCAPRTRYAEREFKTTPEYTQAIHRAAADLGVPLAEVYDRFRTLEVARQTGRDLQSSNAEFLDMVHPTVDGHELYASIVADALEKSGLLAKAPKAAPK